jgi:hypothetical protein
MHEHVGKRLPPPEQRRRPVMQRQVSIEVNARPRKSELQQYHNYIDNNEVFYNIRERLRSPSPEICHAAKIDN